MRYLLTALFGTLLYSCSYSQSLSLSPVSAGTFCATGKDTLIYRLTASNIPPSTNVVLYQSADSTFNPYLGQGDSIGFVPGVSIKRDSVAFQNCLQVLGIFIDACGPSGQEGRNEYMILTSGTSGFLVNDIGIDFSSQNNSGAAVNGDINLNASVCSFKTPDAALIATLRQGSCNASNVIPVGPGGSVPPNAFVVIFTSDSVNAAYSLNGLCSLGYPVYVLQSNCVRQIGAFTNAPRCDAQRIRTTSVIDNGNQCSDDFTYDLCGIFDKDGTYAIRQETTDTASVANNGIRRNTVDSCGGIDYTQLAFSSDTILRYPLNNPLVTCNTDYYIKAVINPPGSQPVSEAIPFRLICLNLSVLVQNSTICTGSPAEISMNSNDPNATFTWQVFPGVNISGASNGSGSTISQVLTNSSATRDSIIYRITARDQACNVIQDVKIYVDPNPSPFSLGPDTSICGAFSKTLSTGNPLTIWSTGVTAASITVTSPGTYWAKVPVSCGDITDTIVITTSGILNPVNLGPDTSVCGPFSKTLSTGDATTVWSTGATAASITVSTPGTYWARISNLCGVSSDTIRITQAPPPDVGINGPTSICTGNSAVLSVTGGPFDSVRWNNNAVTTSITVSAAGTYFVTAYKSGCSGLASIDVTVGDLLVTISGNLAVCSGSSTALDAGPGYDSYSWSTGASSQTVSVAAPGQYRVTVTQGSCTARDTVDVIAAVSPVVNISGDTLVCFGANASLDAGAGFLAYDWSIGDTTQTVTVGQSGTYSVTVSNGTCPATDSIVVVQRPQITFDLDIDSLTCVDSGAIAVNNVLQAAVPFTYQLNSDPPQGTGIFTGLLVGTYTLTVTDAAGCSATQTAVLAAPEPIVLDLGADVTILLGNSYAIPGTIAGERPPLTWNWTPATELSCTNCVNPVATPDSTTRYLLVVTDSRGCVAADSLTITVFEIIDVYLPSAFTPNGDGLNDVLTVLGNPLKARIEQFMIFDRWGEKLFESSGFLPNDTVAGWDGTYKGVVAMNDSYVFYIAAVTNAGEKKEYKGTFTLLR